MTCILCLKLNRGYITPWNREQHATSLLNTDCIHMILENRNKQPIGFVILFGIENRHGNIELMRIVITDKGKGYGKEAIGLIQEFVFSQLKAHHLWLDVKDHNLRAIHVYESTGFQVEGKLRECIRTDDRYESLIIMGILEREYVSKFKEGGTST
ncbi:GNAT family protein [Aneurinibacillus aneurinilyticus]|nr:GNAT family protein [Aneurinibacillus aneurinilyticus]MED0706685.1 GNAT family protein [Aneurinibacillus aneurinilyticus]MED0722559.1 GNAT family protein [Aneurinibacillus aneurinilyticus]MED0730499.1 GNAT family protein [Aneurinibacillus aneurinilyticus]MED0742639.1 GNAT family protein [Aneurinibacillus aneurinilyticus]